MFHFGFRFLSSDWTFSWWLKLLGKASFMSSTSYNVNVLQNKNQQPPPAKLSSLLQLE